MNIDIIYVNEDLAGGQLHKVEQLLIWFDGVLWLTRAVLISSSVYFFTVLRKKALKRSETPEEGETCLLSSSCFFFAERGLQISEQVFSSEEQ